MFVVPFVVLAIIGIGLLFFKDKYIQYQKEKSLESEDLLIAPTQLTNGWLTYTSLKANFTLSYPKNWPLTKLPIRENCGKPCVERLVFAPPFDITKQDEENLYLPEKKYAFINVLDTAYFPVYKSFDEKNRSINRDKQVSNVAYLMIGGEKAVSYKYVGLNPQVLREYWTIKNGFQYVFLLYHNSDYLNDEEYIKTFEAILATFKFTQ
ncbi:MAG: hypothetical protein Q8P89_02710 [bacterium]|nr:hypothetical protein [bacterium]